MDKIKAFFAGIGDKINGLSPWKKGVIVGAVVVALLTGSHTWVYFAGAATCKQTAPTEIKPSDTPKPKTDYLIKPVETAKQCGDVIDITAEMVKDKKVLIVAQDRCKRSARAFDLDYHCPILKNQLGVGPGVSVFINNQDGKVVPMIGGVVQYTRFWGNLGFGPAVRVYGTADKLNWTAGVDAVISYRW